MIVQLQKQNIDTNNGFRRGLHNTLWKSSLTLRSSMWLAAFLEKRV